VLGMSVHTSQTHIGLMFIMCMSVGEGGMRGIMSLEGGVVSGV